MAVGGGIPWLPNLQRQKRLGQIAEVCGIMNGTTNYILDVMHKKGYEYDSVLQDAQRLGYAEADPTADIEGLDVRRKLMISANVAFDPEKYLCYIFSEMPGKNFRDNPEMLEGWMPWSNGAQDNCKASV